MYIYGLAPVPILNSCGPSLCLLRLHQTNTNTNTNTKGPPMSFQANILMELSFRYIWFKETRSKPIFWQTHTYIYIHTYIHIYIYIQKWKKKWSKSISIYTLISTVLKNYKRMPTGLNCNFSGMIKLTFLKFQVELLKMFQGIEYINVKISTYYIEFLDFYAQPQARTFLAHTHTHVSTYANPNTHSCSCLLVRPNSKQKIEFGIY